MKGGGVVEGLFSLLFIVAVVGSMVLGGYLALKYVKRKEEPPKAVPPPAPKPEHHEKPANGWGPGPWGPDPWTPNYDPDVPSKPQKPDNFKPVLTLMNAKYDPVNRYIQVDYKILPSGSVPPSKTYTLKYDLLVKGKRVDDFPEDEPLTASEMSGFQQTSLVPATGAPSDVKASDLSISAQIHFRENGTASIGVIGVPVTINVT